MAVNRDAAIGAAKDRPAAGSTRRGRVCLYAPYLFPVLDGNVEFAGGSEVQQWLIARGLARRGFDMHVVTCDFGQPPEVTRDGVTLIRSFRPHAGIPGVRFFHPRLTRAVSGMRRAAAEVLLVKNAGFPAGLVHDVARWTGAGFVFLAGHDHDARPDLRFGRNLRDRWWFLRAIHDTDALVCQSEAQRRLFRDNLGVDGQVITNAVEIPDRMVDAGQDGVVVWLATYKPSKRPDWFTRLAARLPQHRFVMCGVVPPPPLTSESWEAARRAAATTPNLEVRGFLSHERLGELFARASLFVHTSPAEGFPNTVLEAWAHGLPSVTCVDPDAIAQRNALGDVVGDFDALEVAVGRWMADPVARRVAGQRARAYVQAHHAPERIHDQLAAVVDGVVARVRARRGAAGP
jgi:glycosyltransferase involved in cell wall biosynthesis